METSNSDFHPTAFLNIGGGRMGVLWRFGNSHEGHGISPEVDQERNDKKKLVFQETEELLKAVLHCRNLSVFAYGQTGSGK